MFRSSPPPDISSLAGEETDLATAAESIHYHWFHEGRSTWKSDPLADHIKVVDILLDAGMSHRGYDYPDWRQFSVLDFSAPTRAQIHTMPSWFKCADLITSEDRVINFGSDFTLRDPIDLLQFLKDSIALGSRNCTDILLALLASKYRLIRTDKYSHDAYMPIYLDMVMRALEVIDATRRSIMRDSTWPLISTLHLWPYEIGTLDVNTFKDVDSWMITSYGIVSWAIGNDL